MTMTNSLSLFCSLAFFSASTRSTEYWTFIINFVAFGVIFKLFLTQYKAQHKKEIRKDIEEQVRNELAFAKIDAKRKVKVIDV